MKPLILFFAVLVMIPMAGAGAEDAAPRTRAEQFFGGLIQGDADKAYAELFAGSLAMQDPARLEQAKQQISANLSKYGKPLGYELAIEKTFGTSLVRLVYILKMEKHPVVWEFFFYRPKETWFLANFDINDEFRGLREPPASPKT